MLAKMADMRKLYGIPDFVSRSDGDMFGFDGSPTLERVIHESVESELRRVEVGRCLCVARASAACPHD